VLTNQNLYSFILIATVLTVRASWSQSVPKPETPAHLQDRQLPSPGTEDPAVGRSGASDGAATKETLASTETEGSGSKAGVAGTSAPTPAPSAPDGTPTPTKAASRAPTSVAASSPQNLQEPLVAPTSLFDVLSGTFKTVETTVEVEGTPDDTDTSQPQPFVAGGADVIASAGTFGDISRFLQVLPGVVATSDLTNEFLVRGGHPMENLFLVDGIEVPNINHIATLGTTGGFAPMIDSGLVQSLKLFTGGYDAMFPERLSSVTEIRTLDNGDAKGHEEGDVGIQGFGGLREQRFAGGDLLTSAHHGIMDAVGKNAGIDGIPTYTNEFSRFRRGENSGDQLSALNVTGWDSVSVTPCPDDIKETSSINSQYNAWRETTGAEWRHIYSPRAFAVIDASDSEQVEHVHQQDQILDPMNSSESALLHEPCPNPGSTPPVPVYTEDSNSAFSTVGYRFEQERSPITLLAGTAVWLQRPHYRIEQPIGAYSPYSVTPTRADSASFASNFATVETGNYLQLLVNPTKALSLSAGTRLQSFAFGSHLTITPRFSARYQLGKGIGIHVAFAQYGQMPPYVYLVSYQENHSMQPMRVTHEIAGVDVSFVPGSQVRVEAYNKQYRDMPAATEYPSVNLHDMVDMLGDQIVWLPMNSSGLGTASGIEVSDITRIRSRFMMHASIAYSRAKFAGTDRVLRASNFDLPWIVNVAAVERIGRGYELSGRYGYATGRPYTPIDIPDSEAQNRPIYEVSQMNAVRAPYYSRLDLQVNKDIQLRESFRLELYFGVENLLNRQNFLSYVWMPRIETYGPRLATQELYQIPIFPNLGVRFVIR